MGTKLFIFVAFCIGPTVFPLHKVHWIFYFFLHNVLGVKLFTVYIQYQIQYPQLACLCLCKYKEFVVSYVGPVVDYIM